MNIVSERGYLVDERLRVELEKGVLCGAHSLVRYSGVPHEMGSGYIVTQSKGNYHVCGGARHANVRGL